MAGAEIVAEPGDDERHPFEVRAERLQLVDRHRPVGGVAHARARSPKASRPAPPTRATAGGS